MITTVEILNNNINTKVNNKTIVKYQYIMIR